MSSRRWAQTKLDWEDGHGSLYMVELPPRASLVHTFHGDQTDTQKGEQYGNNTHATSNNKEI
jgi:hypothetical protein